MNEDPDREDAEEIVREHMVEGRLTRFTCPECSGSLWEVREGSAIKLRCRVSHAFTEESYLAEQADALESALWTALTTLEEKADFARRLRDRFAGEGQRLTAARYGDQEENALAQAASIRRVLATLLSPAGVEERQAS